MLARSYSPGDGSPKGSGHSPTDGQGLIGLMISGLTTRSSIREIEMLPVRENSLAYDMVPRKQTINDKHRVSFFIDRVPPVGRTLERIVPLALQCSYKNEAVPKKPCTPYQGKTYQIDRILRR